MPDYFYSNCSKSNRAEAKTSRRWLSINQGGYINKLILVVGIVITAMGSELIIKPGVDMEVTGPNMLNEGAMSDYVVTVEIRPNVTEEVIELKCSKTIIVSHCEISKTTGLNGEKYYIYKIRLQSKTDAQKCIVLFAQGRVNGEVKPFLQAFKINPDDKIHPFAVYEEDLQKITATSKARKRTENKGPRTTKPN